MTTFATIPAIEIPKAEIVGPYSDWPRRPQRRADRAATGAAAPAPAFAPTA